MKRINFTWAQITKIVAERRADVKNLSRNRIIYFLFRNMTSLIAVIELFLYIQLYGVVFGVDLLLTHLF